MATFRKVNQRWQARISWYDDQGKRHYKSKNGFATKAEAKRYAAKAESKKYDGTINDKEISYVRYYQEWYQTYKANKISDKTAGLYRSINSYLIDYFGNKKISKITRRNYQLFINSFGKNHAKSTVKKFHSILKAVAQNALYDSLITKDFTHGIELTWDTAQTWEIDYPNLDEIQKLIDTTKSGLNPRYTSRYMILTAFYTGMRLAEIAGLTWEDIDFNWKTININKTLNHTTGKFAPTKNKSSVRIIRVNQGLLNILQELKANHTKLVFENCFGKVPYSNGVNKTLRKIMKQADVSREGYHFHSIRHSHVAMLLYRGVPIYAISKRLGHSDITTTTRKYAYMLDELRSKADDNIENILDNLDNEKSPVNHEQKAQN